MRLQNLSDSTYSPIEKVKIYVAPAVTLSGVMRTSFLIIPYLILKGHQNYEPTNYVKIITSKIISQYTGDHSHALEHCQHSTHCTT